MEEGHGQRQGIARSLDAAAALKCQKRAPEFFVSRGKSDKNNNLKKNLTFACHKTKQD
jgi:hypothetical protein